MMDESLFDRRNRLRQEIRLLERQSRDINRLRAIRTLFRLSHTSKNLKNSLTWQDHTDFPTSLEGRKVKGYFQDGQIFVRVEIRLNMSMDSGFHCKIEAWDRVIEEDEDEDIFLIEERQPFYSYSKDYSLGIFPRLFWYRKRSHILRDICKDIQNHLR